MTRGAGLQSKRALAGLVLTCLFVLAFPLAAVADVPHVATELTTDTCAMCHRAHTAAGDFARVDPDSWEMTSSALALAVPLDTGDAALCYVCHGVDALGSGTPVGASFEETSVHTLAPLASPFGPSVKYCSSCHDSHGTDKVAADTPYPALLRARMEDGTTVFTDSEYCGTCHQIRAESTFDGVAVYEQTAHYLKMPDPASGTLVRCSVCHTPHGSAIAPLIVSVIPSNTVTPTETITANDRTLCFACHEDPLGTYSGETTYATSAHAVSTVTTTVPGEWAADDATRLVGECQVCHAPMGADDGTGAPIGALLTLEAPELCLQCHDADGVASTDLVALQYPDTAAADLELVAAFSPETTTAAFGAVGLWTTEATTTVPRTIVGPRFYEPAGFTGDVAVGDIDGDGRNDVVVADPAADRLTVLIEDPLKGLTSFYGPGEVDLAAVDASLSGVTAEFVAVADVFADASLLPEVVLGDADTGDLHVLRWDIYAVPEPAFVLVHTEPGAASVLSGIAAGDLDAPADGYAELVVTDADIASPVVAAFTESGITPDTFAAHFAPVAAGAGVRGPSIGDAHPDAGLEIAVANAGESAATALSLYAADGTLVGDYAISAAAGVAWDTLIADVWSDATRPGEELAVAVDAGTGASSINVFWQDVADLGAPVAYATGTRYGTGSLAAGDLDGDGDTELAVGNAGVWSRESTAAAAPSIQIFEPNAASDAFDGAATKLLLAGGVERAGAAPALAIADLGGVGPSRHPVGAVEDAHVSTETAPFPRHVECSDCHNSHEATSTVSAAPDAYGRILGTFGATAALLDAQPIASEYELCYKCHSAYQDADGLEGAVDVSDSFDAANASVHAVEQSVTTTINAGTFVDSWDNDSVLYCIDCHSIAGATPPVAGPHTSSEAPILKSPYLGVLPSDADLLCYDCHEREVYYTGSEDTTSATGSFFWDADAGALHSLHVADQGFGCVSCHASHGSVVNEALVRDAIDFERDLTGGSCIGPCHPSPDLGITPGITYAR